MNRYCLTASAQADVDAIWLQCARDAGTETADRLISRIEECCRMLGTMSGAGRARADMGAGIRRFPAGSYIIYYRKTSRNRIQVVRVIHGRRDQKKAWRETSGPHRHR